MTRIIPSSMRHLPLNQRGYPVPWFAAHPERLSVLDRAKRRCAIAERRCWVCGRLLGRSFCFVLGPAQAVIRTASEPPSHPVCARFAVTTCPFMLDPRYQRHDGRDSDPAAHGLHNPGCFAVWRSRAYEVAVDGRLLVGAPEAVAWYCQGRPAEREQVLRALDVYRPQLSDVDIEPLMCWLP